MPLISGKCSGKLSRSFRKGKQKFWPPDGDPVLSFGDAAEYSKPNPKNKRLKQNALFSSPFCVFLTTFTC